MELPIASVVEGQDELKEYQETQYNLLMLQQKRNELEQLRTLLQVALESGDMETLGQLGDLIQSLPDVPDVSESQEADKDMESLFKKQVVQRKQLENMEKEQENLNKYAEEHRETLAQKRGKLQELQLKLSEIKSEGPWTSTEAQVVTLVNPDGLDRNISNVTLIDESFNVEDEGLEEEMVENELYLEEQERSLNELRQRIEMLQKVKQELEIAQNADNEQIVVKENKNAHDDADNSDETLESLLRKLASASIEDIKAADFNVGKNCSQLVQFSQNESEVVEKDENLAVEDENTEVNIRESISQAKQHVKDLESAISATNNMEEKKVYMELHTKLSQQLLELVEVESKLNYYRSIINSNNEEDSPLQDASEVVIKKPEVPLQPVSSIPRNNSIQLNKTPPVNSNMHQSQIESLVNSKRSAATAWGEVSKVEKGSQFYESSNSESGSVNYGLKRSESSFLPRRIVSGESRRPTSSMAAEGSWKSEASSTKSKRLFDSMKNDIYRHAASLITTFENEPYFLLSFLKRVSKIDSSYLKQKLLVTLDNLLEEEELEGQSAESVDEGSIDKNYSETMNTDCEIIMKSRISEFLMGMIQDSTSQILNAFQLSKLNYFVLSLVQNILYSTINGLTEGSENFEDRLTILIDLLKPALDQKTEFFQGKRTSSVQAELLATIFEEIHHVCEDWAGFLESNNRFIRWEHFSKTSL